MQRYGPFSCILRIRLEIANLQGISFAIEKTPHVSLTYKLVPVHYREYENKLPVLPAKPLSKVLYCTELNIKKKS